METPSIQAERQTEELPETTDMQSDSADLSVTSSEIPPPSSIVHNQSGTSGQETSAFTSSSSKDLSTFDRDSTKDSRVPVQEATSSDEMSAPILVDEIVKSTSSSSSTPPSEEQRGQGQLATSGLEAASRAELPLKTGTDDKALLPPQGVGAATSVRAATQNQPASGASKASSSTSYFPSSSAISSFFSSAAKATSPPKQHPVITSASSASLEPPPYSNEGTTNSQDGGTGRGTQISGESKEGRAVAPIIGSMPGPTSRSSPATSPPSSSSFAALMTAAASYVKPAQAKTPKLLSAAAEVKPPDPEPASKSQEGVDRPLNETSAEVPGDQSDRSGESKHHPSFALAPGRPADQPLSNTPTSISAPVQKHAPFIPSTPLPTLIGSTPQAETAAQSDLPLSSPGPPLAGSLAQASPPSTSYLSLPSFLPSWSNLTAQLPSMPNTSFSSSKDVTSVESLNGALPAPSSGEEGGTAGETSSRDRVSGSTASIESHTAPSAAGESQQEIGASSSLEAEKPPPKRELDAVGAANAQEMAAGIAEIFGPITREADKQVETALRSQERLALSIDRLTKGLDKLLEETPQPLVSQQAARLAYLGKRVKSLGSTLKVIQGRIDSMNWALDRKSARAPVTRGRSATAPNSPQSYQAPGDIWATTSSRNATERSPLPTSWELRDTNQDSQASDSQSESKEGPQGHDLGKASMNGNLLERPSSRSPEKGHRRAVSHDVRFSSALLPRR